MLTTEQRVDTAKTIAEQIWREQSLTTNRMTWNLTFQGFMIAGFALVATADFSAPARKTMEIVIAVAALVVALATLLGVLAAQRQSSYLKGAWVALADQASDDPAGQIIMESTRPFSDPKGSAWGRLPARIISLTLIAMWVVLVAVAVPAQERAPEPVEIRLPQGVRLLPAG